MTRKKIEAVVLIVFFTLMVIESPRTAQLHPAKDIAEAIGQLTAILLFVAGLFYSVRWYMKLNGHTYNLSRQAWASILFWYSLLAILIGLVMMVSSSFAIGAPMAAIWACSGFAFWRWRGRLRCAEANGAISK